MTLIEYITAHGVAQCARHFGVSRMTVTYWRNGTHFPSRSHLKIILAKTPLTVTDIYGE